MHALDWVHAYASGLQARGIAPRKLVVDMQGDKGSCNGCKQRERILLDDLKAMFPQTHVGLNVHYSQRSNPVPAVPGRNNSSTYGALAAEPRVSAYGRDQHPGTVPPVYWQQRFTPGGPSGAIPPSYLSGIPIPQTGQGQVRSDSGSPHTPSPPGMRTMSARQELASVMEQQASAERRLQEATRAVDAARRAHGLRENSAAATRSALLQRELQKVEYRAIPQDQATHWAGQAIAPLPAMQQAVQQVAATRAALTESQAAEGTAAQAVRDLRTRVTELRHEVLAQAASSYGTSSSSSTYGASSSASGASSSAYSTSSSAYGASSSTYASGSQQASRNPNRS
ncbi:hypothetical protein ACWD3Z_16900 [Streptomyces sp. NPDC002740]